MTFYVKHALVKIKR